MLADILGKGGEIMKESAMNKEKNSQKSSLKFEMPDCKFGATCGSCIYYKNGWTGYCTYHKQQVSSSQYACASYA